MKLIKKITKIYWELPIVPMQTKECFYYRVKTLLKGEHSENNSSNLNLLNQYRKQILNIPTSEDSYYHKEICKTEYKKESGDPKLIAYYLTQFHPTPENNKWWGRGITEWNNVSRAVPQFVGHYQPRLPGELGFYDLRIEDNILRQVELAKMYGIAAFCFYFYWFDGKRLLERPLDIFVKSENIDFPFCLCWANESWTKAFLGNSREVIMKQNKTTESYKTFIHDAFPYLADNRYFTVKGKKVLQVYKPQDVPDCEKILEYWRSYCLQKGIGELYIIGCWTCDNSEENFIAKGFDAVSEFQPGAAYGYMKNINKKLPFVSENFNGAVYSYEELVNNQIYKKNDKVSKLYRAIMPMWDNTARRNNKGNLIFDGSTPELYKKWLKDVILSNRKRNDLDDNLIFINAWNEWGEGAYLEPDKRFGYAYLQATKEAIEECRDE